MNPVVTALMLANILSFALMFWASRAHGRAQRALGHVEAEEDQRSRIGALVASPTFMPTFTPYDEEAVGLHERLLQLRLVHIKQAYREEIHRIESGEGAAILNRVAEGGDS